VLKVDELPDGLPFPNTTGLSTKEHGGVAWNLSVSISCLGFGRLQKSVYSPGSRDVTILHQPAVKVLCYAASRSSIYQQMYFIKT